MSAPTPDEIAKARAWHHWFWPTMPPEGDRYFRVLLAALDAAERERKDNVGALEDAGVERNEADEIASGIEALAKDRDEWSDQFGEVAALVVHDLEPGDEWLSDEVIEAVKELQRERDELARWKATHSWSSTLRTRAETAEARVVELEAGLRALADEYGPSDCRKRCLRLLGTSGSNGGGA